MREWLTPTAAAKRLGLDVEEVLRLVKEKRLEGKKEMGVPYISKESVYAYNGLKPEGRQTTARRGRKPVTIDRDEAARLLKGEDVDRLVFRGELELFEDAITRRSVEAYLRRKGEKKETVEVPEPTEVPAPASTDEPERYAGRCPYGLDEEAEREDDEASSREDERRGDSYSEEELTEALRWAYMKGRLDVYESLKSFERR